VLLDPSAETKIAGSSGKKKGRGRPKVQMMTANKGIFNILLLLERSQHGGQTVQILPHDNAMHRKV
jgi:hypothetical protein